MQRTLFIGLALMLISCGDGEGTDAGPGLDDAGSTLDSGAGGDDAGTTDAGSSDGGATGDDAGSSDAGDSDAGASDAGASDAGDSDAGASDAGADAGMGCPRRIDDRVAGVCDGRGRAICAMWARDNGGSMATAQCVPPAGRCARADACTDAGCTCGGQPECGDDEMCVSGFAGFSCVCLE